MIARRLCLSTITLASLGLVLSPAAIRPARAATGRLRIGGTGMALAVLRLVGSDFLAAHPGVEIDVLPSLGTGGGLAAVRAGAIELAISARPLSGGELAQGLHAQCFARTPIVFVTQAQSSVTGVTLEEVARILRGETTTWPDGSPLRLVRREPSDADWTLFRSLSPDMGRAVELALKRPGLLTVATDQANAEALERLRGSFGAMALGQLRAEALRLKPLLLDGVAPEAGTLVSSSYRLSRSLYAAWNGDAGTPLAAFLAFLLGPEGQAILLRLGHASPAGAA